MVFCLRIDLDYVPWDTPDAEEFGHGEPAATLRILSLARERGLRFQFFASSRVLRAFPATTDAILSEAHDLDWLCKHPYDAGSRWSIAQDLALNAGHRFFGLAHKDDWPTDVPAAHFPGIKFLSSTGSVFPPEWNHFSIDIREPRSASRSGQTVRAWTDQAKKLLRDSASRNRSATISIRPQSLAKWDPGLTHLKEILDLAMALEMDVLTMRQQLRRLSPGHI
jgi:hypothetical protein